MLVQVSHHPPVAAAHAENDYWVYDIVSAPTTKFLGNSVDIYPVGEASKFKSRRQFIVTHALLYIKLINRSHQKRHM